ncbi:MAG: DNA polymerase III subunit gamma/tau [Patescibacteria group bacterium]|nr:DNA polymerase III subunit gamma/tau [Patescibacteria group bacterium]
MATLYRKYRPKNWQEVVNQNHIKTTLTQEILSNKMAHAYLFSGPRGVGKTTIARVMAASLNCKERSKDSYEPCGKCGHCTQIEAGTYLDIIEVDAASHTGVDNIRENIIAASRVPASLGKYKIFIIDEVHMLSISAFNALLKLLEEPPKNILFILCTTEIHKIPATIISRCERFDFKRISVSDLVKKLNYIVNKEKIKIDKKILEALARQAEGHMRDAESMLGQIVAIGGREITQEEADLVIPRSDLMEAIKFLKLLNTKNAAATIELINHLIDEGIDLERFSIDFIELLRRLLLMILSPGLNDKFGLELGENIELELNELKKKLKIDDLIWLIKEFNRAKNSISDYFIVQLPFELVISEYCGGGLSQQAESQSPKPSPVLNSTPTPQSNLKPVSSDVNTEVPKAEPNIKANSEAVNKDALTSIKMEEIFAKWHEVLARVKKHNHSLSFILRVCQPRNVQGNQVCLAFRYKFHKDRISEANIKKLVEDTFSEVYGQTLSIEAIVDESISQTDVGNNGDIRQSTPGLVSAPEDASSEEGNKDMLNNLLKTFGGKVVK